MLRLRSIAEHIGAAPCAAVVEQAEAPAFDPSVADSGWPLNLRQNDDGSIVVADLAALKERELAAAAACQYRLAAQLHSTRESLRPKPAMQSEKP